MLVLKQAVALEAALDGTYKEAVHGPMWRSSLGPDVVPEWFKGSENLIDISRAVEALLTGNWTWFQRRYTDELARGLHGSECGASDYTAFRVAIMALAAGKGGPQCPAAYNALQAAMTWWCLFVGANYQLYPVGERNQGHWPGGPQIHMLRMASGLPCLLKEQQIRKQGWLWPLRVFMAGKIGFSTTIEQGLASLQVHGVITPLVKADIAGIKVRNPFSFIRHENSGLIVMHHASNGNGAPCYAWKWSTTGESERLVIDKTNRKMHAGYCTFSPGVITATNSAGESGSLSYSGVGEELYRLP